MILHFSPNDKKHILGILLPSNKYLKYRYSQTNIHTFIEKNVYPGFDPTISNMTQLSGADDQHELTCFEENFGAVIMLHCTGHMKRCTVVAVVGLHERSVINHELNTI